MAEVAVPEALFSALLESRERDCASEIGFKGV